MPAKKKKRAVTKTRKVARSKKTSRSKKVKSSKTKKAKKKPKRKPSKKKPARQKVSKKTKPVLKKKKAITRGSVRVSAPKLKSIAPVLPISSSVPSVNLEVGQTAPDFTVKNDEGSDVSLSSFEGKKVVLYFYPKDDTPGCTVEACSFRDGLKEIETRGAVVLGVSVDSVDSHQAFKSKYSLNFSLLSDSEKQIVQAYGVWKEKSMYGRTYMGIERTTFLIDEKGKIEKIFPKVSVEGHFQEVIDALDSSSSSSVIDIDSSSRSSDFSNNSFN